MNYLLTKKQNEVMKYLAQGLSNKEIMAKMGIKYTTLRSHLVGIYQIFGVHDKLNAVLTWQRNEREEE